MTWTSKHMPKCGMGHSNPKYLGFLTLKYFHGLSEIQIELSYILPGKPSCKSLTLGIVCFSHMTQSYLTNPPAACDPSKGTCVSQYIEY